MSFVHLHTHSQFSILDGTATAPALANRAAELEMSALALTDSANLYGAVAFSRACEKAGIKPVFGAELHVQPEGLEFLDPAREEGGYQLIALVRDATGYQNLCALVTAGIFEGMHYKPRVDLELLRAHHEGLFFLTGGLKGALAKGQEEQGAENLHRLLEVVGTGSLFLELQDHGLEGQQGVNDLARRLSSADVPTVVTNAAHYLAPAHASIHELLNAIAAGCSVADERR